MEEIEVVVPDEISNKTIYIHCVWSFDMEHLELPVSCPNMILKKNTKVTTFRQIQYM
jgi:hypothetical protein